jgi:hypothetical protein
MAGKGKFPIVVVVVWMLIHTMTVGAQAQAKKFKKGNRTEDSSNISLYGKEPTKKGNKKAKYISIYRTNPTKVLYGNRCVDEQTHKMGFEYVLVMPDRNGDIDVKMVASNIGNSILLTFKNGPFWSQRIKKKIKECRQSSGDFVG